MLHRALSAEFNRTGLIRQRFCGIQANTSPLPPEELDGSAELKCSGAEELADGIAKLADFIDLKFVGGCCGTDNTHLEQIAKRITQSIVNKGVQYGGLLL